MKKRIPILVDKDAEAFILEKVLDNKFDRNGFILNEEEQPVLTQDLEPINLKELAIFRTGSKIYIKKDIVSLVKYAADLI